MTDIVESIDEWDRCYPGNLNVEVLVADAKIEITRLRQLLSEADKREREARAKALEEAVSVAEAEYKRHCTGSGFDSQPARSTAHRILEAIKALQSEER